MPWVWKLFWIFLPFLVRKGGQWQRALAALWQVPSACLSEDIGRSLWYDNPNRINFETTFRGRKYLMNQLWIYKSYYRNPDFIRKDSVTVTNRYLSMISFLGAHGRSHVLGWATMPGAKDGHMASLRRDRWFAISQLPFRRCETELIFYKIYKDQESVQQMLSQILDFIIAATPLET